ncbi:MAG: NADP-dependent glyceraldehyde-3-phosphate dehydrogenase [Nitrospinota bacterium]|nr:NADP-dependent glyceraldehyde-3-phosphate dehydrogenase [Nitrospinota bacterium]
MRLEEKIDSIFPRVEDIPEQFRQKRIDQNEYLIGGKIHRWEGPFIEVQSPICAPKDGRMAPMVIGGFPSMTPQKALEALKATARAYDSGRGPWPTMGVQGRIEHVLRFARAMREKREEVVRLLMWEIGKTLKDSEKEFDRTVDYIIDTTEALKDMDRAGSRFEKEQGVMAQIRRAPLGVTLCMGPYNYPLNETFATLIPALIMGNCVLFKPAKHGVLLLGPLLEAFAEAFPPGVVNTVYGEGASVIGPIMESGLVDCLAFIGSDKVADTLKKSHPKPHRLRCILGLGAKNPAVILPEADLDLAVAECVSGALSFNGQRCTAIKIIFVHESVAQRFADAFAQAVEKLKFGMPWEDGVTVTPLPVPGKPQTLAQWVEEAKAAGSAVINAMGGTVNGTYFHPAVVYPAIKGTTLYTKEQFGPVVPIVPYADITRPIRYIEHSAYGQQAAIFGADPKKIAELIDPLVNQVCRVNINSQCQRGPDAFPFTGRKGSAEGTLSVSDALRAFSIRTLVAAKDTAANREIFSRIVRERSSNFLSTDYLF